jgi:putative phosphoesterase
MMEALKRQVKRPDAVVFLGDGLIDISYCDVQGAALFVVEGNCDYWYRGYTDLKSEKEILINLGGKRIMMVHGHEYGVKSGLARIVKAAAEKNVDIVLFGHTHQALEKYLPAGETEYGFELEKPLWLFNPGAAAESCFGCVEIDVRGRVMLSHGRLR